ncbi:ABC transporter [Streptomyces sp. ScaeMP-e83]|nr:ABC transporter [Streptomyces sp. ScaeMP-e83]
MPQDKPLYPQLTVADTLWAGGELNPGRWDRATADRIAGKLPRGARVRTLSGGQRTRLALALALGKRPELMLLDEPMADLDPLARHELMGVLMAETAEHGTTIVMSSHILTELEGACDFLLFVDGGRVRLGGEAEDIVGAHALVTGQAGRELESGTFRMAWAQSVSPARWRAARLVVPAALSVAGVGLLSVVYRWAWTEVSNPNAFGLGWFNDGIFPGIGPVAVGYALVGVTVGALCALLIRRMLLSMAVTTVVLGVVMTGFTQSRWMLWPVGRLLGNGYPGGNAWITETGMLTASGEKLLRQDCPYTVEDPNGVACMKARGGVTEFTDYHPASHFWPLQLVETGILLALAALAVFAAFRVLRRLHG